MRAMLQAMRELPRERFVRPVGRPEAYDDNPLPIAAGQTISQPYIVAFMSEALQLRGGERVLEIGTGSGCAAAVLGRLAKEVHGGTPRRAGRGRQRRCAHSAWTTMQVHTADGTLGYGGGALRRHRRHRGRPRSACGAAGAARRRRPAGDAGGRARGRAVVPLRLDARTDGALHCRSPDASRSGTDGRALRWPPPLTRCVRGPGCFVVRRYAERPQTPSWPGGYAG